MILQNVLDSIYLIPAILDHMDKPTHATAKILEQAGIGGVDLEKLRKIRSLLQYHHNVVQTGFQSDYPLLRKGLAEYHDHVLSNIWYSLNIYDQRISFLDYGCGDGAYGRSFKAMNEEAICLGVDKAPNPEEPNQIVVDFEKMPDWYKRFKDLDLILLAEVLHCKDLAGQRYLVNSSYAMLKKSGRLLIVENNDPYMEYRINKIKKAEDKFTLLSEVKLAYLMGPFLMRLQQKVKIYQHTAYLYEKL